MSEDRNAEDAVEKHIQKLTENAMRLIARQQGIEPEEQGKKKTKGGDKSQMGSTSVTGANRFQVNINVDHYGASQKSANLRKMGIGGIEEPGFPKRFYEEGHKRVDKDEVKGTTWYDEYFLLEEKIERQKEENEKQKREIARRTERYIKNEQEYRQEINELEREIARRKGFEDNQDGKEHDSFKDEMDKKGGVSNKLNGMIIENIENYEQQLTLLQDEQTKELARKFKSMISRTKKSIEQEKAKSGDKAAEEAERENELQHHLELITNIAQRTHAENAQLKKNNNDLKAKFEQQETQREFLVKELVLQKKDNTKLQTDISSFKKELKQLEKAREEQQVDLDNIEEPKLFAATGPKSKASGLKSANKDIGSEYGRRTANFSATTAGRSTVGAAALSRVASNQQSGPLVYMPQRKVETEEEKLLRYDRVMEKLRKMMQHERRLLKTARLQYNKELASKTELEILLKQAVDKVKSERKQHKRQAQKKEYTTQPGLGVGVNLINPQANLGAIGGSGANTINATFDEDTDLNQHERERVIELMLSQERVISLLYEKTFPMTSQEMHSAEDINDMQNLHMQHQLYDMQQMGGEGAAEYGDEVDEETYARMQQELLQQNMVEQVDEAGEIDENFMENTETEELEGKAPSGNGETSVAMQNQD